jgi:hypothetical protein
MCIYKLRFRGIFDLSPKFSEICFRLGSCEVYAGGVGAFPALLGPSGAEELRWYLEKFFIRPTEQIRNSADKGARNVSIFGRHPHGPEKRIRSSPDMMMMRFDQIARINADPGQRR